MTEPTQADRDAVSNYYSTACGITAGPGPVIKGFRQTLEEAFTAHRELGQREGRELERAEIVAWIRRNAPLRWLAEVIERGDPKGGDDDKG